MPLWNILAVGAAVFLTAFISLFGSHTPPEPKPVAELPSLGVVPTSVSLSNFLAPLALTVPTSSTPVATTGPALDLNQVVIVPKQAAPAAAASATAPTKPAPTTSVTDLSSTVGLVRGALVNIICIPKPGLGLRSASASGIVIDARGVILTVAHMAQYFLLADYPKAGNVSCVIRAGSPAANAYKASLAYISPDWVRANDETLTEDAPTGTGENDFALLVITSSTTRDPLPPSFTAVPLSSGTPAKGEAVTIGSYGAEFLSSAQVQSALYPIVVFGSVGARYTFDTNTVDLLAIDRTAAAQEGSSGGGVVNADRQLIGLITTSSSGDIAGRDLHAITPRHIRESFQDEMDESLDAWLADNTLDQMVSDFSDKAAKLSKILAKAVE